MSADMLSEAARLSDQDLLARVQFLARREREATAALIAHLAVLDERRLYLAEGCPRLFIYCTQVLHFSEAAAYRRIEVARVARQYPLIITMLAEGSVTLTNVLLLAPELTPANHRPLLAAATHKSKDDVEELVASLRPKPLVPPSIRKLPVVGTSAAPNTTVETPSPAQAIFTSLPTRLPAVRRMVSPLAPERFEVQFTASAEMRQKLQYAQDLLRHRIPNGDIADVLDLALTALIKNLEREKLGASARPRSRGDADPKSRHVPAKVRREVWARDGGRCAFVAQNGRRCVERGFLQFHHVRPYSAGGPPTVDNIELRCWAHNQYEAEQYFGPIHLEAESKTVQKLGL
jgi:hypothetical protein